MKAPKTVEEARGLPEIRDRFFETIQKTGDDGVMVEYRHPRPFVAHGLEGDDILSFMDANGEIMDVVAVEGGYAKCRSLF